MSDPSPLLDRAGIEEALRRLGDRLARRGVVADLYVFGGAAMAPAYDSRRTPRDVDALFKPLGIVLEAALMVAAELGLPRWWLNEQASSGSSRRSSSCILSKRSWPRCARSSPKRNRQRGSGFS